ncbi:LOW QUALITY PROTEIN: chloride channel protein CLC-f, partial [Neltuma alba]|uniref:LOW QUALITY PROTEIN: chloride channel protein CLC-f n=1 Tax=Neltuma alba TaxID=207710 RepID=UPI0010A38F6A
NLFGDSTISNVGRREDDDQSRLLGESAFNGKTAEERKGDVEVQDRGGGGSPLKGFLKKLDREFSGRRHSVKRDQRENRERRDDSHPHSHHHHVLDLHVDSDDALGDSAPPEWALLLIGCLLGLATGLCVAAFNKGVHLIHEWAWAGTPTEGAAWLRLQRLSDTWHRILLIPVTGGVIVGLMHGLLEIMDQIKQSSSSQTQGFDLLAGFSPTIKAIQAAVTLGTGGSLGPEGPSVDIGKSCANGFSLMMENNREKNDSSFAAGAAAGISSGFNAAVAGCFFAIETVLRPLRAENSPPFTTAMIILASVISSTVSNVLLGTHSAFTVPAYDLKSAAGVFIYLCFCPICCPPQAYALVGMAATLASVCSVPLTSVLLLFELTKDYRILLPLMGAVGLAIWVPSVTNQSKENDVPDSRSLARGYSSLAAEDNDGGNWRQTNGDGLELSVVGNAGDHEAIDEELLLENLKVSLAMSKNYLKASLAMTLREATKLMDDGQQNSVLVVDDEHFLEGILTYGDIKRFLSKKTSDTSKSDSGLFDASTCLVSSACTRGISYRGKERGLLTCYPDTTLAMAKDLMEAKGIKQLPVVQRGGDFGRPKKQRIVALLHYDSLWNCLRNEISNRKTLFQSRPENSLDVITANGN